MKRARRAVLWTLLALAVLGAALLGDAHWRASKTFERHEREVADLLREFHARSRERPSIYGESVPGNAWDHYAPVLAALKAMPQEWKDSIPEMSGEFEPDQLPDEEVLHDIYLRYAPQIEELRRGLRSSQVDLGTDPHDRPEGSPELWTLILTFRFLGGAMSHEHRAGSDDAALQLAVVLLGLAQDIGSTMSIAELQLQLVGEAVGLDNCATMLAAHSFSHAALEQFAARLDSLARSRPGLETAFRADDIYVRTLILGGPIDKRNYKGPMETIAPGWRQLFSQRLMRAGALEEVAEFFRELEACVHLPTHEQEKRAASIGQRFSESRNPIVADAIWILSKAVKRDLISRMNLTLLRVAVALAWYEAEKGKPPASLAELVPRHLAAVPVCPLTGLPLGYAPGQVWSAGPDGKDDGGVLDPDNPTEPIRDGFDVVWRVRRRSP